MWLWYSYDTAIFGMLRAWWIPYLLIADPRRATRYRSMFARTHAFLPAHNGIRPNTLHVILHVVLVVIAVLLATMS